MHLKNSLLKLICRGKQSEPFGHWNKYLIRVNNNYHREPGTLLCQLIFTNCYFHFSEVEAEGQSHWTYSSHSLCLFHFTSFFLFYYFFWCGPFLVFVEFVTVLLLFYGLGFFGLEAYGILAPLARDGNLTPCTGPPGKSLYLSYLAKVKRRVPSF